MDTLSRAQSLSRVEWATVGGARVARLDLTATARLMMEIAQAPSFDRGARILTSVNGEVLALAKHDARFAALIAGADLVSADGQAMVFASQLLSRSPLPERVATTDLYPLVAAMAQEESVSFYLLGAKEPVNRAAFEATRRSFPRLDIRGRSHGYLTGTALEAKLDEINDLAPDILWLGLGVPREQEFAWRHAPRLSNVKMIKTSGGLFDFVAGAAPRAPLWMQQAGLEWLFRVAREPRRLARRYVTTNPVALALLVLETR